MVCIELSRTNDTSIYFAVQLHRTELLREGLAWKADSLQLKKEIKEVCWTEKIISVYNIINIKHGSKNVSETPIWGTAQWFKISVWWSVLPWKKAVPEQQDLENCPAPFPDVDSYNST